MPIKYERNLNKRLINSVRNYNRKVERAENAGYSNIPEKTSVYDIKRRYSSRSDLMRELKRLESFSRKDVINRIKINDEFTVPKWQLDYVKVNRENAINYYQNEYRRIKPKLKTYPALQQQLDTLKAKINLLNEDYSSITPSHFRSVIASIGEFTKNPSYQKSYYRGFLNEVDWVMDNLGYSEKERTKFFNKFKVLTPTQFLYLYDNNDIIKRIYELYHKDYEGDPYLTLGNDEATQIINSFIEDLDVYIKDAKENMV